MTWRDVKSDPPQEDDAMIWVAGHEYGDESEPLCISLARFAFTDEVTGEHFWSPVITHYWEGPFVRDAMAYWQPYINGLLPGGTWPPPPDAS